jgi:hypothetical protein
LLPILPRPIIPSCMKCRRLSASAIFACAALDRYKLKCRFQSEAV